MASLSLAKFLSSFQYSVAAAMLIDQLGNTYPLALVLSALNVTSQTGMGNFLSPTIFTVGNSFSGSGVGNFPSSLAFASGGSGDFQSLGNFSPSLAYSALGTIFCGYSGANVFALALALSALNVISEESLGDLSSLMALAASNAISGEGQGQLRSSLNLPVLTIFGYGTQSSYSSSAFLGSSSRMTSFPGTWRLPIDPAILKIL